MISKPVEPILSGMTMVCKAMRITELREHSKDFGSIQLSGDDGGFPCMARVNVQAKELWNLRVGQELIVKVELPETRQMHTPNPVAQLQKQ